MNKNIKTKTYPNGLRLVVEKDMNANYVAFVMKVLVGSSNESEAEFGLSHFVEHMVFKSSKNYSTTSLLTGLESLGARIDAWTSYDQTTFSLRCLKDCLNDCLTLHGDMMSNPLFLEEEFEQERKVILEEINLYLDNPEHLAEQEVSVAMHKKYFSNAHEIIGLEETLNSFTPNSLRMFMDKHYRGENIVFSVVGNVEFEEIEALIEKHYAKFINSCKPEKKVDFSITTLPSPQTIILDRDTYQAKQYCLIKICNSVSPQRFVANLYNRILGGGHSSRLHIEVRENNGLAYAVYSFNDQSLYLGYLVIYIDTYAENLEKANSIIFGVLKDLAENDISEEELQKAKMQYKSAVAYFDDDKGNIAESNALQTLFFGEILSNEERLKIIDKITIKDIREYAQEVYNQKNIVVGCVGKGIEEKHLKPLLDR